MPFLLSQAVMRSIPYCGVRVYCSSNRRMTARSDCLTARGS
jgi:hypothetical protein